jgi:hypothetical protein
MMIRAKSRDTAGHRRARHTMKKKKIQNGGIGGAPVVGLVFGHVNADLLTWSRCEHIVLLTLESPLTYQKFRYAAQQSAAGMHSVLELLMKSLQFLTKLGAIPFHDFVNECSKAQRHKFLQFPGVVQAQTPLRLHPLDEHRALKLLRQFAQAGHFLFSDTVAQSTITAAHFSSGRTA